MTIVWNAQRVSEGLTEIESARGVVLASVKKLLDEYHGVENTTRFYDIILGDWIERYLHLVYVASQNLAAGEKPAHEEQARVDAQEVTLFGDSAEFFAKYTELPKLALSVIESLAVTGPTGIRLSGSAITIKNSFSMNRRDQIFSKLLRIIASRNLKNILFVKPISGKVSFSWFATMLAWRKWASHDDFGFSFASTTIPDLEWRQKNILPISENSKLSDIARSILPIFLPVCFVEAFQSLKSQINEARPVRFAHVYSAQALWTHFAFKLLVAQWCELGTKLHYHQHGGWYGLDETHVGELYESRVADNYYTWGWSRGKSNTMPLSPITRSIETKSKFFDSLICFDQPQQIYRLQYFPLPGTLQTMYDQTAEFVRVRKSSTDLRIRLFPGDYGSHQRDLILKSSPGAIFDNSQEIYSQYARSRIVFHSYLGTSWLETLGNNIPTICFYDVDAYRFRSDAKELIDDLVKVGILHLSGSSAAEKANSVEVDLDLWWMSEEVQAARDNFVDQFANFSTNWRHIWRDYFMQSILKS